MIPLQHLIVTCESPATVADFWEQMTEAAPDVFNSWFVVVSGFGTDD